MGLKLLTTDYWVVGCGDDTLVTPSFPLQNPIIYSFAIKKTEHHEEAGGGLLLGMTERMISIRHPDYATAFEVIQLALQQRRNGIIGCVSRELQR